MLRVCIAVDLNNIGLLKWYDWKLGRMNDQQLAILVATLVPRRN